MLLSLKKNENPSFHELCVNHHGRVLFQRSGRDSAAHNRDRSFDSGWRFLRADAPGAEAPGFDDTAWRTLDVPHDWSIEDLPPLEKPPVPELPVTADNGVFKKATSRRGRRANSTTVAGRASLCRILGSTIRITPTTMFMAGFAAALRFPPSAKAGTLSFCSAALTMWTKRG